MKKKHQVDRSIGQSQYQDCLSLFLSLSLPAPFFRGSFPLTLTFQSLARHYRVQSAAGDDRGH